MGVDLTMLLVADRHKLQSVISNLAIPPDDPLISDWRPETQGRKDNLIEFVASGGHLDQSFEDRYRATSVLTYRHVNSDFDQTIFLRFDGRLQNLFHPSLNLTALTLDAYYTPYGLAALFSATRRKAFFHVLETLGNSIVFAENSTHDGLVDIFQFCSWQAKSIDMRDRYNLLSVGPLLAPYFDLERLRSTQTYLKWELPGPLFLYVTSAVILRREFSDGRPVLTYDLPSEAFWDGLREFASLSEEDEAVNRSWTALEHGLALPIDIPYQPEEKH